MRLFRQQKGLLLVLLGFLFLFGCSDSDSNYYSLTIVTAGDGSGTVEASPAPVFERPDGVPMYLVNTPVTLTAVPGEGAFFAGFDAGECTGANSCTIRIQSPTHVTATFTTRSVPASGAKGAPSLVEYQNFPTGIFDESAAEIPAYDPENARFFVVNGNDSAIDVFDLNAGSGRVMQICVSDYGDAPTSVACKNGILAAAVPANDAQANGVIVFFDTKGNYITHVQAGALPDMVTFTPDGSYVLAANEGEPNDDYTIDPEGSITVVDISGGVENALANTIGFSHFNSQADSLRVGGVNIYGPNATVAQDLEPEYIAVTPDSKTAFVSLQENNAIARVDIQSQTITHIFPLGYKDHSKPENAMDASNKDDRINITTWPVMGMYQPDAIVCCEIGGNTYILTANEGDSRDYDGFSEEERVKDVLLDPAAFPDAATLQKEENLGRLNITLTRGDADGDGDFDKLYSYGARSFSIFLATDESLTLVYDSGDDFETIIAEMFPEYFNASNDDHEADARSDDKGPEPEAITIGMIDSKPYAFIGLERAGGIMIYDISSPASPEFVNYINNRNTGMDPEAGNAGDLGPEGLIFIPAEDSPAGTALLVAANEVSGNTRVYQVEGTTFDLAIMHVNDTHSHLDTISDSLVLNGTKTYLDMGGFSRLYTKVKEERAANENFLLLHAGDAVQGTLYYTKYNGQAEMDFMNLLGFDAMTIGNHEFDRGPGTLSQIMEWAGFPVICANIDVTQDGYLSGMVEPVFVKQVNGEPVGIIGLLTDDTPNISNPGQDITFLDPETTTTHYVDVLESMGVNKIIVLSHMGYEEDLALARAVDGVDIIISGHSHTLLGDLSDAGLSSDGRYPTWVGKENGAHTCIVQAWEWAKAVGMLRVSFDENGNITRADGNPVILVGNAFRQKNQDGDKVDVDAGTRAELESYIASSPVVEITAEDSDALALLAPYKAGVDDLMSQKIADVAEPLLHERIPGTQDETGVVLENGSLIAPIVTDAYLWKLNKNGMDVDMTIQSAGGVRIDVPEGDFTVGTAYQLLPFGNTLVVLTLTGQEIIHSLEDAVERILNVHNGAFPYVSGARFTADVTKPYGERIVSVEMKENGTWTPIDPNATYRVAANNYMAGGGDAYSYLADATERGDAYDTGFGDAEALMEYAEYLGTLYAPETFNITYITEPSSPGESITIKIAETTDIHGNIFPYDFIEDSAANAYGPVYSLAHVSSYVKQERAKTDQSFILVDNGDILQGQPTVYYFNFEVDLSSRNHLQADVMNYMEYDSATVGNHDLEAGHAVYDQLVNQFDFPFLSANAVHTQGEHTGEPYFTPYTIIEKQGVKIAIIGLTTPHIPHWLPENLWEGMEFEDMIVSARKWVSQVETTENPDLIVGVFHSGFDYTYSGDEFTPKNENASQLVAMNVPEFDVIFLGHDHQERNEVVNNVLVLGGAAYGGSVAEAVFTLSPKAGGGYDKNVSGNIVSMSGYEPDTDFMSTFSDEYDEVYAYVSRKVGEFTRSVSSRDAMFGDSAFVDLVHRLQFDVAENTLDTKADISFCAPLQQDTTIHAGNVYVRDMFKLYKYENLLYVMELTGQEIISYLEYNYGRWMNQMETEADHLIHFTQEPVYDPSTGKWSYSTRTRYYNYDSAAGIDYTVDVTKPQGERITVSGFSDGRSFDLSATYRVAINSYRGNGGGGHLISGAGIPEDALADRMVTSTDIDLRYYLMKRIETLGTMTPEAYGNWKVIPEYLAEAGMILDYEILYGNPTFAVLADPHYYDTDLGTQGAAFESYITSDRKLIRESEAITRAAVRALTSENDLDFVIVSGDLTKDGAYTSHTEFAGYMQDLEDAGISVYVIPGNHDVLNPHAYGYEGENVIPADYVTPQDFASIYADFGYNEALYRDPASLSYIAEPVPGVWVFALDSANYGENMANDKPETGGGFSETTLEWIKDMLALAFQSEKQVFAFQHHGMIEHFAGQSTITGIPAKEYVIDNWLSVSRELAENGLDMVFTGHYHSQDITTKTYADGYTAMTDVETGSLVTWPCPYRVVTLNKGNMFDIQSRYIDSVDYAGLNGMQFSDYAKAYLQEGLLGISTYTLLNDFGVTQAEADLLAPMIAEAFMAHYAGDETPASQTMATVSMMADSADPTQQMMGQMLYTLWSDLPPADNNAAIRP